MKKSMTLALIAALAVGAVFAAQNYRGPTGQVKHVAAGTIVAGNLVDLGTRYGVALVGTTVGQTGVVLTEGVFSFKRATTNAITAGLSLYYSAAQTVTTVALSNKFVGVSAEALGVATTDEVTAGVYVDVDLNAYNRPALVTE